MIWKDIKGYEGFYQASSTGLIRNTKTLRIIKQTLWGGRYLFSCLFKNGKKKTHLSHRLIAEAFCFKESEDFEVNHIDGDRLNNKPSNLVWCSHLENIQHSNKNGLVNIMGRNNPAKRPEAREKIRLSKIEWWKSRGDVTIGRAEDHVTKTIC